MSLMMNIQNFDPFWLNVNIVMPLIKMMLIKRLHLSEFSSNPMLNFKLRDLKNILDKPIHGTIFQNLPNIVPKEIL